MMMKFKTPVSSIIWSRKMIKIGTFWSLILACSLVHGCTAERMVHDVKGDVPLEHNAASSTPNVIVILADDMRADHTGYAGHPIVKTPHIDQLAENGAVFLNAFATSPVCTPSRTTLLTGQYERKHGINFNSNSVLSNEDYRKTYPMLLGNAGYYTGYIGKNHTPIGINDEGQLGYDSGVMDVSFDYWYASHSHLGFYPKDYSQHAIFKNAEADTQVEILEEGVENFFTPNEAFQAGYDFLENRPKDQPFALLINFNVPHNGGTGTMAFRDTDLELYKSAYRDQFDKMLLPENYVALEDVVEPKLPKHVYSGEYIKSYNYVQKPEDMRERETRVVQTITGIDKLVGALRKKIQEYELSDNTIIIFTSDHGILHGEFGLGGKSLLYEAAVKVPLIIYDPRIQKGQQRSELVGLVDLAPTILDYAGLEKSKTIQGKSIKPLLYQESAEWRQELFLENMMTIQNYPRIEGVRTNKWKYMRYFDKEFDQDYAEMLTASINGEEPIYEELYDIEHDPNEVQNLSRLEDHQAVLEQLRASADKMVKLYRGDEPLSTLPVK